MGNIAPEQLSTFMAIFSYYSSIGLISAARWMGFFFIFPFFRWITLPTPVASSVAVAFSLPMWPNVVEGSASRYLPVWPVVGAGAGDLGFAHYTGIMGLTLKEFVIGAALGLLPALFFYGLTFTGEMIDQTRGDTNASTLTSGDGMQMTNGALLLFIGTGMMFFQAGAFFNLILLIYASYASIPIADPAGVLNYNGLMQLANNGLHLMMHTVMAAWPLAVLMLSFHLLTLVQSKVDKKFQGADFVPPIRNLVFMGAASLYLQYMSDARGGSDILLRAFEGAVHA